MKPSCLIIILFASLKMAAQSDSIHYWLGLVGRSSVQPTMSYVPGFWVDSNCLKLIRAEESYKFPLLIEALECPDKTFAVHVILTTLLDTLNQRTTEIRPVNPSEPLKYEYNGVQWLPPGMAYNIDIASIPLLKKKWLAKLHASYPWFFENPR